MSTLFSPVTTRWTVPQVAPATVFGELTADGTKVVIIASGEPVQTGAVWRQLSEFTPKGTQVANGMAVTMPLSWPLVTQLACTFGPQWTAGGRLHYWTMGELARRTQWVDRPLRYELPAGLALKPYQPIPVRMVAHLGCLLEDQPRLGKTVTTIVGLAERACWPEYPSPLPIIVVCPASVVTQWVREFELWAPHLRTVAWRGGNKETRRELVGKFDVYVASYAVARSDAKAGANLANSPLARVKPGTLIADEYHWLSNPDAAQTRATQRLARQAGLMIPLSGTPFTHNLTNMHPTLEVFEPGVFPSGERIGKRYCVIEEKQSGYGRTIHGLRPDHEAELRTSFLGRQIRRTREDVAAHLSEKTYSTRFVEIPPHYAKMYRDMELRMIAELDDGEECTPMTTITKIQRLQQLSASACDLSRSYTIDERTGLEKEHQHLHPRLPSWKIDAMLEVLAELSWPALVFGVSKPLVMFAGQAAEKAGAQVGYIVGGQSHKKRDEYKDAFQAGKLDVLCVVVEAGGTGLTLSAAGTEIFLQRPYSYVNSTQAEDRAVGDRYPTIDIVDIYAELPNSQTTIDQRIRDILLHKAARLGEYFADPRVVRQLFGGDVIPRKVA